MGNKKAIKQNQSVLRALSIIEKMAEHTGPIRLQDLAKKINLPSSTCLRYLNTLITKKYIKHDPIMLQYYLTMKLPYLGSHVVSQLKIQRIARPYLIELSKACQESACLAILQDLVVVYIDVVEGPDHILRTLQRIGKIAPAHCTGVGKCLLMQFSDRELDDYISSKGLTTLTRNTITSRRRLIKELELARMRGFALDNEECENHVRCVAAPVRDCTGKIVASISISGPSFRLISKKLELVKNLVKNTAHEISESLGCVISE